MDQMINAMDHSIRLWMPRAGFFKIEIMTGNLEVRRGFTLTLTVCNLSLKIIKLIEEQKVHKNEDTKFGSTNFEILSNLTKKIDKLNLDIMELKSADEFYPIRSNRHQTKRYSYRSEVSNLEHVSKKDFIVYVIKRLRMVKYSLERVIS